MNYREIIVDEKLKIKEALKILDSTAKKVLFVTSNNKLAGAVSDGDVRRWILKNGNLDEPVETIMNHNPVFVTERNRAGAIKIMKEEGINAVPSLNVHHEIDNIFFLFNMMSSQEKNILDAPVVIIAGGKGERLLPYTSVVPKPLIPVGGKPIIERIIDNFVEFGCKDFSLILNYKKNMIKAYFDDLERDYHISYIEENVPLGTGGGLCFLKNMVDNTFFVSNCDILLQVDYYDVYEYHKQNKNAMTVITSLKHFKIPYGIINTKDDGSIKDLIEKPSTSHLVNTGVYLIEPKILNLMEDNQFTHITAFIEECIKKEEKVGTYPISEDAWLDMGELSELENMKLRLQKQTKI